MVLTLYVCKIFLTTVLMDCHRLCVHPLSWVQSWILHMKEGLSTMLGPRCPSSWDDYNNDRLGMRIQRSNSLSWLQPESTRRTGWQQLCWGGEEWYRSEREVKKEWGGSEKEMKKKWGGSDKEVRRQREGSEKEVKKRWESKKKVGREGEEIICNSDQIVKGCNSDQMRRR